MISARFLGVRLLVIAYDIRVDSDSERQLARDFRVSLLRCLLSYQTGGELGIGVDDISDRDIVAIFQAVDGDASGNIDSLEFVTWLIGDESEKVKRAL